MATKKTGVGGEKQETTAKAGGRPVAKKAPARPKIRSSYATTSTGEKSATKRAGPGGAAKKATKATKSVKSAKGEPLKPEVRARSAAALAAARKAAPEAPKRTRRASLPPGPMAEASQRAREAAVAIASLGVEKKALGIQILDVASRVDYAEILVIMTGRSDRHVHAIATGVDEGMRKRGTPAESVEGLTAGTWVLLDFGDVVVHVFQEDARRLYDLEGLWIDASRIPAPRGAEEAELRD